MDEQKCSNRNIAFYTAKESIYVAINPVLCGTIMQQFLLYRGVSPTWVGLYTTLVSAIQMVAMVLFAGVAEGTKSPLKHCTRILFWISCISLAYLPVAYFDLGSHMTLLLVCVFTIVQISLHSFKYVYDFRINYQIVQPAKFGTMVFLASAFTGVGGIGFSWLFARMIDRNTAGNPYFICMVLTLALLLTSVFFNSRMRRIYELPTYKKEQLGLIQQFQIVMKDKSFRQLIIPNLMRGITLSITGCIVLIALVMDIDESGRAKIPLVCAMATALASVVYMVLAKKLSVGAINIVGGILTCAIIFMPRGNTTGFLILFFIGYLGRIIVDNAVPTMLFPIVDPKIAGSYNAWRSMLYNLCSIAVTPIVGALVEIVHPLWLLIPAAVSYVIVTIWYYIVYEKFAKE